jgi:FAD:protein FMN transferase
MSAAAHASRRTMPTPMAALLLLVALIPWRVHAEWLQGEQAIMGTRCVVELWSTDRARGQAAIDAVFVEFRRIDALMSTYKPDSELSRVNAAAATAPVQVSQELYDLLATSIEYSKLTGGAFDVTYASVGYLYDYRAHVHPDARAIAAALPGIDYRHIELIPDTRSVRFRRPGVRIDLGGIAKGHAVDRGIAVLEGLGIDRAMVNAGGDTRIIGDRFGEPWMVGIRDPRQEGKVIARIPLVDAALSTSGDYERFFEADGVRYHHILSPSTGKPASAVRSVTVIGPTATRTDGLSKTIFVLGIKEGMRVLDALGDVDVIAIDKDEKIYYSKGLARPGAQ